MHTYVKLDFAVVLLTVGNFTQIDQVVSRLIAAVTEIWNSCGRKVFSARTVSFQWNTIQTLLV